MICFQRSLGAVALGLGLIGLCGCQEDNEATLRAETAKNAANAPAGEVQPRTQADMLKLQQQSMENMTNYPGAKKKYTPPTPKKK